MSENLVSIGRIAGVFGIRGEMKIRPTVDDEVFEGLESLFINETPVAIRSLRKHKENWLLGAKGIDSPEDAALNIGKTVMAAKETLPPPAEDEIYWADIKGASVVDTEGVAVGVLMDYIETGSHDVFEIEGTDGEKYLISNNPDHVTGIDADSKTVTVKRDGLVEES